MTKLALLVLCAQALLIQTAYGQCLQSLNQGLIGYGGANQVISSGYGCGNNIGNIISSVGNVGSVGNIVSSGNGGYGGYGNGELGIVGTLPIGGNTFVEGNLPVIGIVEFNGALPAGGYVTIAGNTPNECGNYGIGNCGCY